MGIEKEKIAEEVKMYREMYKEHILDLYKNPSNYGELADFTHHFRSYNSLCGDDFKIWVDVKDNKIKDVSFTGSGCAISTAASSMVSDKIIGMNIWDVSRMNQEDVLELLHIPVSSGRMKCAVLFLKSVQENVLKDDN